MDAQLNFKKTYGYMYVLFLYTSQDSAVVAKYSKDRAFLTLKVDRRSEMTCYDNNDDEEYNRNIKLSSSCRVVLRRLPDIPL